LVEASIDAEIASNYIQGGIEEERKIQGNL
jgi:hypothetical protein